MKYIIVLVVALFVGSCTMPPQATEEDKQTSNVYAVNLSKAEIYSKSLQWLSTSSKSDKQVIEIQDSAQGLIVGNGAAIVEWWPYTYEVTYKIRIDIKDQKCKFSTANYVAYNGDLKITDFMLAMADKVKENISQTEKSFYSYLTSQASVSDF